MKIIPLSEGSFTVDKTKLFVPFDENMHNMSERPPGSLLVEVQPFIVITEKDVLLLDAGLGFSDENGTMQIHKNMMDHGINPSEITKVLMSHLHKDHSGGVGRAVGGKAAHDHQERHGMEQHGMEQHGESPTSAPAFPSAKYYIQQKELELALSGSSSSYITEDLECLRDSAQVELLNGSGTIDGYIEYELTSAHSKFHQVFWIRENNETAFFGGDDAPQFKQMKSRYMAKYDYDGKKCMELRHKWLEQGTREHWSFLFYHDIKTAVVRG